MSALDQFITFCEAHLECHNKLYAEYANIPNAEIATFLCNNQKKKILFWEKISGPFYLKRWNEMNKGGDTIYSNRKKSWKSERQFERVDDGRMTETFIDPNGYRYNVTY